MPSSRSPPSFRAAPPRRPPIARSRSSDFERLALWRALRGATGAAVWNHLTKAGKSSGLGAVLFFLCSVLSRLDLSLWNVLCFFYQDGVQAFLNHFLLKSKSGTRYKIHGSGDGVHGGGSPPFKCSEKAWGHGDRRRLPGLIGAHNTGFHVRNWFFLEKICLSLIS